MPRLAGFRSLVVALTAVVLLMPLDAQPRVRADGPAAPTLNHGAGSDWTDSKVEFIDGLQGVKPHGKGTLTLDGQGLAFTGKAASTSIAAGAITAVSVCKQRVELGGTGGRIARMLVPDGGGIVIATFAHHRIGMLTVDFTDPQGGMHSAVFFLGATQAGEALAHFARLPRAMQPVAAPDCRSARTEAGALLVAEPDWQGVAVPAVYQGLTYERLVERFGRAKGVTHVYREGQDLPAGVCPQYVLRMSITGFKQGSSIERAMLGPVGLFVGTTQMRFNAHLTDRTGAMDMNKPVKSTVRGEEESTDVARKTATTLEKRFEKALKKQARETAANGAATRTIVPSMEAIP